MSLFWLILFFPLLGAFLNGLPLRNASKTVSHVVGVAALVAAFICALITYLNFMQSGGQAQVITGMEWIEAGGFKAPFNFILDRLSGLMLLIITGIGSLIHIYAGGYMHEEKNTYRFFSYLNLFVFMMLLLVLGDNMLVMFIGWEGVGLCSYLLIGYWYQDDANAAAGMKAFLVNRIGDIGFLLGIFATYKVFGTVSFSALKEIILGAGESLNATQLTAIGWITLALFVGACGKSAQLPLYVWLPDAMAGPTPVSALIHAATMVTAGIYMMTRLNFLYYLAPSTQFVVASVGAATALFAATIALVQYDIKKVLAYSTVSQLGYMVLGCGVGAYSAGVFHLFTHACFKALLFLGAGSVIVAMHHKQDMREMGGLKKYMPVTHFVMLIGVLAIIGFPGLSGFFSKDEILWRAWVGGDEHHILWSMGALAALCTAFYMVRLLMLTFYGDYRGAHAQEANGHAANGKKTKKAVHESKDVNTSCNVLAHKKQDQHPHNHSSHDHGHTPHETSPVMWAPLVVLAVLSAFAGYLNVPHIIPGLPHGLFEEYLAPVLAIPAPAAEHWHRLHAEHPASEEWAIMAVSVLSMLVAAGFAIQLYRNGFSTFAKQLGTRFESLHRVLTHKYYVDEFYFAYIVNPLRDMSEFMWKIIDTVIIDGVVNGVGQACTLIGGLASFRMSGSLHRHAMVVVFGILCMLTVLLF